MTQDPLIKASTHNSSMRKHRYFKILITALLACTSAACNSQAKVLIRSAGGTSTLTPFALKATYTSTTSPVKTFIVETPLSLGITATEPTLAEDTSVGTITGTPFSTQTSDYLSPVVSETVFTVTPAPSIEMLIPTATSAPTQTTTVLKTPTPSSTSVVATPSLAPDQKTETYTQEPPTLTSEPAATSTPTGCAFIGNSTFENQVIDLINQVRSAHSLPALAANSSLRLAARRHSEDMACTDLFSHTGSDGSTLSSRLLDAGYSYSWAAENIAASSTCSFSAQSVVDMWMNSTGHRNNILSVNAVHIGVGFRCVSDNITGDLDAYYTADFGRP